MPTASRKKSSSRFGRTRKGKYGAIRTEYRGVVYDSKSEAHYAMYLDALVKAKKIAGWDRQRRVPLVVNGVKVCTMVPDFLVLHRSRNNEYVEVKGMETAVYKLKAKLFRALYPDVLYTVVKAKDVPR